MTEERRARIRRSDILPILEINGVREKLEEIEEPHGILYIQGTLGMGKTTAVREYYKGRAIHYFDGRKGYYGELLPLDQISEDTIVFDDISALMDAASREYVCNAVQVHDRRLVLVSRGEIPDWLYDSILEQPCIQADNRDLELSAEEVAELLKARNISLDEDDIERLIEYGYHNTFVIVKIILGMNSEHPADEEAQEAARNYIYRYIGKAFFDRLDHEMQNTLLCVSPFERFSVNLAKMVTGNIHVEEMLDAMHELGDFIQRKGDEYVIHPVHRAFLEMKREKTFSKGYDQNILGLAGVYYELSEQPLKALEFYKKVGHVEQIVQMLNRMAMRRPGMENFKEVQQYFELIPDKMIVQYPALIAARATIESLMMRPLKADAWMQKLEDYISKTDPLGRQYALAESLLLFLKVTLPHLDKTETMDVIQNSLADMGRSFVPLGDLEMSVIDSTPSLLNGASELSDLIISKYDQLTEDEFVDQAQAMLDVFLDYHATAYMEIVRAEWLFERCEIDDFAVSAAMNEAYMEADAAGALESCFVAINLMCRVYLDNGNFQLAEATMMNFREKVRKAAEQDSNHQKLLNVVDTQLHRIRLLKGELEEDEKILNSAPNSLVFFTILDRSRYIDKLEVLIPFGRKEEALSLIWRLSDAFEKYHRPYDWIRVEILKAILFYQNGQGDWREALGNALRKAQVYGYVRVISDYGAALMPLLNEFRFEGIDFDFREKVWEMTEKRAVNFPNFMKPVEVLKEPLTDKERQVIRLMCGGMTSEAICNMLHISYSGLKFHKQNLYRKLEVNSRAKAERKAKSLGLDLA